MTINIREKNYLYDERAENNVCSADILLIMPHPERVDDRLYVYRWYSKQRKQWVYGVTDRKTQTIWEDYCQTIVKKYIKKN